MRTAWCRVRTVVRIDGTPSRAPFAGVGGVGIRNPVRVMHLDVGKVEQDPAMGVHVVAHQVIVRGEGTAAAVEVPCHIDKFYIRVISF